MMRRRGCPPLCCLWLCVAVPVPSRGGTHLVCRRLQPHHPSLTPLSGRGPAFVYFEPPTSVTATCVHPQTLLNSAAAHSFPLHCLCRLVAVLVIKHPSLQLPVLLSEIGQKRLPQRVARPNAHYAMVTSKNPLLPQDSCSHHMPVRASQLQALASGLRLSSSCPQLPLPARRISSIPLSATLHDSHRIADKVVSPERHVTIRRRA